MAHLRPIVVSGPSGGGKSTLLKKLFDEFGDVLAFSVSHTTRSPRKGELNGKDYNFVDRAKFEHMLSNHEFLEHAQFSKNLYGTTKKAVQDIQDSSRVCVLDLEINGVKNIKASTIDARYIFVTASLEQLRERLTNRGTESSEGLEKRLATAHAAIEYSQQPNSYDHIIVNDEADVAYKKLRDVLCEGQYWRMFRHVRAILPYFDKRNGAILLYVAFEHKNIDLLAVRKDHLQRSTAN